MSTYRIIPIAPSPATSSNMVKVRGGRGGKPDITPAFVTTNPIDGQVFVIGSPGSGTSVSPVAISPSIKINDVRSAIKVTNDVSESRTPLTSTSDRRRATHNEVERRRRDTINSWIMKLGKNIPDLFSQEAGPPKQQLMSKSGILARACEYLSEMRTKNYELREKCKSLSRVEEENQRLQDELAVLKQENELYKRHLEANGIFIKDDEETSLSVLP